ncbi:MAG: AraC family transcriptional regulator [Clostridiales bacterium]|jgi:AraC-like DNA-binding protein|nr:AraC family transcriptional regulator [Clostridiales bacterium]
MNLWQQIKPNTLINMDYDQSFSMPKPHAHYTVELNYVHEGLLNYEYTNSEGNLVSESLTAGQFMIFKPFVPHRIERIAMPTRLCVLELYLNQKNADIITFLSNSEYVKRLPATQSLLETFTDVLYMIDNRKVGNILDELLSLLYDKTHNCHDEFFEASYELMLKKLLLEISQCKRNEMRQLGNKHTRNAAAFIRANYNKNIGLTDIAAHVGMSPQYLQRIFKQTYGETVVNTLLRYRVEKARTLLTQTDLPVSAVASRVGYSKLHSFSAVFKKYHALSPSEFRSAQKHKGFNYSLYYDTEGIHDDEEFTPPPHKRNIILIFPLCGFS